MHVYNNVSDFRTEGSQSTASLKSHLFVAHLSPIRNQVLFSMPKNFIPPQPQTMSTGQGHTYINDRDNGLSAGSEASRAWCHHVWAVHYKMNANKQHQILNRTEHCTEIRCEEKYHFHFGIEASRALIAHH